MFVYLSIMPKEAKRGWWIPWSRSCRWLLAPDMGAIKQTCVLWESNIYTLLGNHLSDPSFYLYIKRVMHLSVLIREAFSLSRCS